MFKSDFDDSKKGHVKWIPGSDFAFKCCKYLWIEIKLSCQLKKMMSRRSHMYKVYRTLNTLHLLQYYMLNYFHWSAHLICLCCVHVRLWQKILNTWWMANCLKQRSGFFFVCSFTWEQLDYRKLYQNFHNSVLLI